MKVAKEKPYTIVNGTKWSVEIIKEQMKTNDLALVKSMLRIFSFQTEDEKMHEETHASNGKGFNALDAEILSSFCKQYESKHFLTFKQMEIIRKKMPKYASQIFAHIKSRGERLSKQLSIIS